MSQPQAPQSMSSPLSPESEAKARIEALQNQLKVLEGEVRTLSGRLENRDPAKLDALKKENEDLRTRHAKLERAVFGLLNETINGKMEDGNLYWETIRNSAMEYSKRTNIDTEIWKNIVF